VLFPVQYWGLRGEMSLKEMMLLARLIIGVRIVCSCFLARTSALSQAGISSNLWKELSLLNGSNCSHRRWKDTYTVTRGLTNTIKQLCDPMSTSSLKK